MSNSISKLNIKVARTLNHIDPDRSNTNDLMCFASAFAIAQSLPMITEPNGLIEIDNFYSEHCVLMVDEKIDQLNEAQSFDYNRAKSLVKNVWYTRVHTISRFWTPDDISDNFLYNYLNVHRYFTGEEVEFLSTFGKPLSRLTKVIKEELL